MVKKPTNPPTLIQVIKALRDEKALGLFLRSGVQAHLTRKQYYSRMEKLVPAGLLKRTGSARYEFSALGLIIRHNLELWERAVKYYDLLHAYDLMKREEKKGTRRNATELASRLFDKTHDAEIIEILKKSS